MRVLVQYLNIHTRNKLFIKRITSKQGTNINKKVKKKNMSVVRTPMNVGFVQKERVTHPLIIFGHECYSSSVVYHYYTWWNNPPWLYCCRLSCDQQLQSTLYSGDLQSQLLIAYFQLLCKLSVSTLFLYDTRLHIQNFFACRYIDLLLFLCHHI